MGNRRRKIVFVVATVLVLGLVGLVWLSKGPPEPSYQGKKLSEWLAALNSYFNTHPPAMMISNKTIYPQTAERTEYENAIRQIGTNAIPFLLTMLQARDAEIKSRIAERLNEQQFIRLHITTARERRIAAFRGFEALGADAEPAVFKLARLFAKSKPSDRTEIGRSLCAILPSMAGPDPQWYLSRERPTYELSRDDLLEVLGPTDLSGDDYASYDISNYSSSAASSHFYLYIQFHHDRVLNSFIGGGADRFKLTPTIRR